MDWVPGFITGSLALVTVVVGGLLQARKERQLAKDNSNTVGPPTTAEVWATVKSLERVITSLVVLLSELADQWPESAHKPVLSRRHVAVVAKEGYMPPAWDPETDERG